MIKTQSLALKKHDFLVLPSMIRYDTNIGVDHMNFIMRVKQKYSLQEWLLLLPFICLSFPIYISVPVTLAEAIYLVSSHRFRESYKTIQKAHYVSVFCLLSLVLSLLYLNWFGIACSLYMMVIFILLVNFRHTITQDIFQKAIDIVIFCSIIWAILAFGQYLTFLHRLHYDHFVIKVFSNRKYRISSVFFNANYYAMMIEFVFMMILYKVSMPTNKKRIPYYLLVTLINVAVLFLSGTRTAWPAVIAGIFLFLIINKNYKWCSVFILSLIAVISYFVINYNKIPRIEYLISNYSVRMKIWKAAFHAWKDSPWLGRGPMTYQMIFQQYGGHPTQHAHSIYLDPLLSFGILGVALILPYIANNIKQLYQLFRQKKNQTLVAFITGCVVITLLHGIFDYTVFFTHTGLLFVFITGAFSIYQKQ